MDIREVRQFMIQLNEENTLKQQLDELSKKTLGSYIVKADKHGSDLALDAGLAFGAKDWKHNETNPEHEENLRKRLKRIKGIKKAVSRLSNENVNEAMISKTAKQTGFGSSVFKQVTRLSKDEKNHIDNGGDVFYDSGRPDNGTNGSTLRRVIKGRRNDYYPRVLNKSHHEMIRNMKEDRREFEYKDLVSLNEAYISIFK